MDDSVVVNGPSTYASNEVDSRSRRSRITVVGDLRNSEQVRTQTNEYAADHKPAKLDYSQVLQSIHRSAVRTSTAADSRVELFPISMHLEASGKSLVHAVSSLLKTHRVVGKDQRSTLLLTAEKQIALLIRPVNKPQL